MDCLLFVLRELVITKKIFGVLLGQQTLKYKLLSLI